MIRLTKMSDKWYGCEIHIDDLEDDLENIETFVEEGTPVLLCESIESAADVLGIYQDEIEF